MHKRHKNICYLGLGSNLGNKLENIQKAVSILRNNKKIKIIKNSSIKVTKAWGNTNQPDFLNCVLEIETALDPKKLLKICLEIETEMGRIRKEKWESRIIDIDILFFGNEVINEENLIIPHAFIYKRKFILESLNEICPDYIHPTLKKKIKDIL
ncbi:MAG TPA: 2-amino-4-hydroxy-6-hydroxymethyldihydropteridine diphosphokinase [Candidatus Cloacimonetes bacterium]|nr:2-amino-4-hydroxy-6-hydroxymethyldihydropteridine diphosphokinase [Candidatus Cloacimonadota bacterium]